MSKTIDLRRQFQAAYEERCAEDSGSRHSRIRALYDLFPRNNDQIRIADFEYKFRGGFEGDENVYAFFLIGGDLNNLLPLNLKDIEAICKSLTDANLNPRNKDYRRQKFFLEKAGEELAKALPEIEQSQSMMPPQPKFSAGMPQKKLA